MIAVGYRDKLDPTALLRLCVEGRKRWGIHKCILTWELRDGANKATFAIDMRDVFRDAEQVLMAISSSMARSANKHGVTAHLPEQFFGGRQPVLDAQGRAVPLRDAGEELSRFSPVHPDHKPREVDTDAAMEEFLRELRDGTVH